MACNNRDQLLMRVYETGFALDDILLYLDTHPSDQEDMNYYHYVNQQNQEAVRAYEQLYGPLMFNQVSGNEWSWVRSPWPWEGGNA